MTESSTTEEGIRELARLRAENAALKIAGHPVTLQHVTIDDGTDRTVVDRSVLAIYEKLCGKPLARAAQ